MARNKLFVSDTFYSAITNHKIKAFSAEHREELEEAWTEAELSPFVSGRQIGIKR